MILAAGLTPAWQQILVFEKVRLGGVNRAQEVHWCASGKVLNVGRALKRLGGPSLTLALIGGRNGENIASEMELLGIPFRFIRSKSQTRVCTTLLDSSTGIHTEMVENAGPAWPEDLSEFQTAYEIEAKKASVAVLSGSLPAGAPRNFYRELLARTSCPVILDASGPELLEALTENPFCIKPNMEELHKTLQTPLDSDAEMIDAVQHLEEAGAVWVLISQGEKELWVGHERRVWAYWPPRVQAVNPIGSGDCLAAGLAWALASGMAMSDAIRFGIAAAAENASALMPGDIRLLQVQKRAAEVTIRVIR